MYSALVRRATLTGTLQSLDQELKAACEMVIIYCSSFMTVFTRVWVERVRGHRNAAKPLGASSVAGAPATEPLSSLSWASPQAVNKLWAGLNTLSATDLRKSIHKLRLYLEDERTVNVLLGHIQDRIVDDWAEWRALVREIYPIGSGAEVEVGTEDLVRAMVRAACDEHSGPSAGPSA